MALFARAPGAAAPRPRDPTAEKGHLPITCPARRSREGHMHQLLHNYYYLIKSCFAMRWVFRNEVRCQGGRAAGLAFFFLLVTR
jgi:hypothetical protein